MPGQYILSVPTSTVNDTDDIVAVAKVYEDIMFWVNKLAGLEKRFRAERFTFDIQLRGGGNYRDLQLLLIIKLCIATIF